MSRYTIGVSDFRIIQKASVKPEGITLIAGGNGEGKSTLIKALRAMLSNDAAGNERHGTTGFGVAVQVGENKLLYMRNRDKTSVKFNDEAERTKLGQNPLHKVEPRFPLKRYDFVDSRFFPNFAMQNSVPVFNEIDIQELFSTMFGSVAKVSDRVTHCRNSCVNTSKERDTAESNSKLLKEKAAEQSKTRDALLARVPNIKDTYCELRGLAERKARADEFQAEYAKAQAGASDHDLRLLMPHVGSARELFPALTLVEGIEGLLKQLALTKEQLGEADALLKAMPDVPVDLVSFMANKAGLAKVFTEGEYELRSLPEVEPELFATVQANRKALASIAAVSEPLLALPAADPELLSMVADQAGMNCRLQASTDLLAKLPVVDPELLEQGYKLAEIGRQAAGLSEKIGRVKQEESAIKGELAKVPCTRFTEGHCPYQSKLEAINV